MYRLKFLYAAIFVVTLGLLTCGCAKFRYSEIREETGQAWKTGVVTRSIAGYRPIKANLFPTLASPYLEVVLIREEEVTEEYARHTHLEKILERQKTKAEATWPIVAEMLALSLYLGDPAWKILMPATFLAIGAMPEPKPEYKPERIPGSDSIETWNHTYIEEVPAPGQTLQLQGSSAIRTDERGIALIPIRPEQCDTGVTIAHIESESVYFVQRIRHEREVKENWVKGLKIIHRIVGYAVDVVRVSRFAAGGASPGAIIVATVVNLLTGEIIGYLMDEIIEEAGTKTVPYFEWIFVQRQ